MFNYFRDYVAVSNGRCNGRSCYQSLRQGRLTITGADKDGRKFQRVVRIVDGEIMDNVLRVNGRVEHRIAYGRFESTWTATGREITRFRRNSGKGRHGKARRCCKMFGHPGVCHSWYKQGRLVRQKFIYDNGRLAYDYKGGRKSFVVRDYAGDVLYRITGAIDGRQHFTGVSVFDRPMDQWFLTSHPFMVEKQGRVFYTGAYHHRQKVGRWVENGRVVFYEHGVAIPQKLYETPPDQLNLKSLLRLPNAQLRMALLEKAREDRNFGKRLAAMGTEVHRDGSMRLYDVKGLPTRVLRVQCPSTSSLYYINVPKDSIQCEEARQWTFHVGAGIRLNGSQIKFTQET